MLHLHFKIFWTFIIGEYLIPQDFSTLFECCFCKTLYSNEFEDSFKQTMLCLTLYGNEFEDGFKQTMHTAIFNDNNLEYPPYQQ